MRNSTVYLSVGGMLLSMQGVCAPPEVPLQYDTARMLEQAERRMKSGVAQRKLNRMLKRAEALLRTGTLRRKIESMQKAIRDSSARNTSVGHRFGGLPARRDMRRMDLNKVLDNADSMHRQRHRYRMIVFISFSMPVSSLKALYRDAGRIGAPLVLRGLVNNRLKDTALAMRRILDMKEETERAKKKQARHTGILIDPNSFKRLKITRVPAFVYLRSGELSLKCGRQKQCSDSGLEYDVVYGDVRLRRAIESIAFRQEDRWLKTYLQQLSDRF